ncbi:hypothetical protein [Tenacibaculum agarivorans]|uniref:hypothetical protein n=1 Tax=Tenacibaculum agarivorans TaxID=1908389 RepID=UPI00094B82F0|nr:hypothetical protein [Tenacibaculum agarivorans]
MKKLILYVIRKLLVIVIPLLCLYVYAQLVFAENHKKEHPTDVGLGIAIVLFFILSILVVIFLADVLKHFKQREFVLLAIDVFFLILLCIPVLNIDCLMGGDFFFCEELLSISLF